MKSVHGLHVFRDVQPAMSKVVQWLDCQYVTVECVECTSADECIVDEKHAGKDELERNLDPHVEDDSHQVILLFSGELLDREFVVVVVLVDEDVVECE